MACNPTSQFRDCLSCPNSLPEFNLTGGSRQQLACNKNTSRSYFRPLKGSYCSQHIVDDPYKEYYDECFRYRSEVEADSIGAPVGLVCSSVKVPRSRSVDQLSINFATYLKAFALIYVLPEVDWTAENIDTLLKEGADLFKASSKLSTKKSELQQPPIYTNAELRVKRNFKIEGHTFTLELEPRYLGDRKKSAEKLPPQTIENLREVLQAFFRKSHYCLLWTSYGYLLIWRRRQAYFVLDIKGRRREDLVSTNEFGVAMLVALKSIDNVVYLVTNLSGIKPKDEFTLRELVVVRLVTPEGRVYLRDSNTRSIEFEVINKNYAYLKSNLHLSLNPSQAVRNRSAVMVGVAAILAVKIDHPATWNTHMYDRLICYGVELCRSCWEACANDNIPINLDTFPTQLRMGQFVIELRLLPNVYCGHWRCTHRFTDNDFEHYLDHALNEYGNALFQINNQMYALWKKNDFYYLLDPYRHTIVGTQTTEDKKPGTKSATVRMFRDLYTMLSVFHQILLQSNRESTFFIHVVRIRNIKKCPQGYALMPLPENVELDVKSLNETICFNTAYENCEGLDEISDYEEDVISCVGDECVEIDSDAKSTTDECEMDYEDECACADICNCPPKMHSHGMHKRKKKRRSKQSKSNRPSLSPRASKSPRPSKSNRASQPSRQSRSSRPTRKSQPGRSSQSPRQSSQHTSEQSPSRPPSKLRTSNQAESSSKSASLKSETRLTRRSSIRFKKTLTVIPESPKFMREGSGSDAKPAPRIELMSDCKTCVDPLKDVPTKRKDKPNPPKSKTSQFSTATESTFSYPTDHSVIYPPMPTQKEEEPNPPQEEVEKPKSIKSGSCRCDSALSHKAPTAKRERANYPGYTQYPHNLAVAGSESGTVESLKRLLRSAFRATDRVLIMTPWGNYVVFQHESENNSNLYYVFDGCTCNIDRFRHLDLRFGTNGLLPFQNEDDVVCHMIDAREPRALRMMRSRLDESCQRFEKFLTRKRKR